jgi:ParB/RepB/Spo0J family partition protein
MANRNGTAGAAAGEAPGPVAAVQIRIRVSSIEPLPGLNTRRFDEKPDQDLLDLKASIATNGLLQPLVLHDTGEPTKNVVAGERRWRACKLIDPELEVPATIRKYSPEELAEIVFAENFHRQNLRPVEQARAIRARLDATPGLTQAALAERLSCSQPVISNALRVLQLPEEILQLIDEGRLEMSQARDLLVPFVKIPEVKRAALFAAVVKLLKPLKEGNRHHNLDWAVHDIALKLSHPVRQQDVEQYHGDGNISIEFDPKEHDACTCCGPKLRYGHVTTVRCFDDSWWNSAQERGKAARVEQERVAREKLASAEKNASAAIQMDALAFRARYGTEYYQAQIDGQLLDASALTAAQLVVVRPTHGGEPVVCCADPAALRKARGAVTKEKNRLLAGRRAERGMRDRAEIGPMKLETWMLVEILNARPMRETIMETGRELGLQVGKLGDLDATMKKLPAEDAELLFKVLAVRLSRGEGGYRDPLQEEVEKTIAKKFRPGMAALKRRALAAVGAGKGKSKKQAEPEPPEEADEEAELDADGADHQVATCVICGCTDDEACDGGCSWMVVDRESGRGVCNTHSLTLREAEAKLEEEEAIA